MAEKDTEPATPEASASSTPGETIIPAGAPRPENQRVSALDLPEQQVVVPEAPAPLAPPVAPLAPIEVPVAEQPQVFVPNEALVAHAATQADLPDTHPRAEGDGSIVWTASEFVVHEKSPGWYGTLCVVAIVVAALAYLLTQDLVSIVVIVFCTFIFAIYAARKPRQLLYRVGDQGISIGQRHYSFQEFQSFTVAPDGAFSSIIFRPLKRFDMLKTIYYAPEDEELIVDVLADRLPFEEHAPDAVDRLMSRIRF